MSYLIGFVKDADRVKRLLICMFVVVFMLGVFWFDMGDMGVFLGNGIKLLIGNVAPYMWLFYLAHVVYALKMGLDEVMIKDMIKITWLIVPIGVISGGGLIAEIVSWALKGLIGSAGIAILMIVVFLLILGTYIRVKFRCGATVFDDMSWLDKSSLTLGTYLRQLISRRELLVPIGMDEQQTIIQESLNDMPHLLIAGATGTGKTNMLRAIIEVQPLGQPICIIDTKGSLRQYKDRNGVKVYCKADEIVESLEKLHIEMRNRYEEREKQDISEKSKIILLIDEYADLVTGNYDKKVTERIEKIIGVLANTGREAGIRIVLATNYPHSDVISSTIKMNFSNRLCFKVPTATNSRLVIDVDGAETLGSAGEAIYYSVNGIKKVITPYVGGK